MKRIGLAKRRGLHTIIGAVFFVLVMGSTIGYVTYSMDLVDDLAYQIDVKQDTNLNRQDEKFEITDVAVVNNEFSLTVKNTGTIPINITKMWAKNMTDSSWNQTSYQLNQLVAPGAKINNIGIGTGLVAMDSESYSLKLLTGRGNALETQVVSTTNQPLEMSLFTTPLSPLKGHNVTLIYSVKNNLTGVSILKSITPQMGPITTTGLGDAILKEGPTPASAAALNPGETALFKWIYEVAGNDGDKINFNATIANAKQGNFVKDTLTINVPPLSQQSINEAVSQTFGGVLTMNFTSFEACEPSTQDCRSNSSAWTRAWDLSKGKSYIWRMKMANNGLEDILVSKNTAILMLQASTGGGGNINTSFYLKADSTTLIEDPGGYILDYSKIIYAGGDEYPLYFGTTAAGGPTLQSAPNNVAIYAVFFLIFGQEDLNSNQLYDSGIDKPYSQNLPYQSLRLT